jgi:predicted NUDIX family phosphoesterase
MKDENVLCVPTEQMRLAFDLSLGSWQISMEELNRLPQCFEKRALLEQDYSYKQLIAYALVFDDQGQVLTYQRCGSEKRLNGIWSAGIGGHVTDEDRQITPYNTLLQGLKREFSEEIGLELQDGDVELLGMINEEETEVGHCHTGVVFRVNVASEQMRFDKEIGLPQWKNPEELDLEKFELWSTLAIRLCNK